MMEENKELGIPWDGDGIGDNVDGEVFDGEQKDAEVKVKVKKAKKEVETLSVDFDALLPHIGEMGRYQMVNNFLIFLQLRISKFCSTTFSPTFFDYRKFGPLLLMVLA